MSDGAHERAGKERHCSLNTYVAGEAFRQH